MINYKISTPRPHSYVSSFILRNITENIQILNGNAKKLDNKKKIESIWYKKCLYEYFYEFNYDSVKLNIQKINKQEWFNRMYTDAKYLF